MKGINSRLDEPEEWTSDLKDEIVEITQSYSKRKTTCHMQEIHHRTISCFFSRNFSGQKGVNNVFKVLNTKNLQPIIFCPKSFSFRIKGLFPSQAKTKGVHHH